MEKIVNLTRSLFTVVLALVLLATAPAKAGNATTANVRTDAFKAMDMRIYKSTQPNTFRVAVSNPSNEPYTVKVRNEKNELLWWENVKKGTNFNEVLSFKKLPAGQYMVEITNDQTIYSQPVEVK